MTASDIDDTLGSEGELLRLRSEFPDLDLYLSKIGELKVERSCVPYGAGISKDGKTAFIDPRLDLLCEGVDISPALVVHEATEWALREFAEIGVDYASDSSGHRLANRAEREVVGLLLVSKTEDISAAWTLYDDFIDPQVRQLEHDEIGAIDPRLAEYPYEETALESYLKTIKIRSRTKDELRYTPEGSPEEHCANCEYYLPERACYFVIGEVSKSGWCNHWEGEEDRDET